MPTPDTLPRPKWRLLHVCGTHLSPGYVHNVRPNVCPLGGAGARQEFAWLLENIGGTWRAELVA